MRAHTSSSLRAAHGFRGVHLFAPPPLHHYKGHRRGIAPAKQLLLTIVAGFAAFFGIAVRSAAVCIRGQLLTSYFAFEGSRFGCGPSARACLGSCCTCTQDTRSSKLLCGSCCRIRCIIAFECICFGSGPSVRACLGNIRFERALAIGALWSDTRSSKLFCGSCCHIRCIQFEYIRLLSVLMLRTCCKR